MIKIELKRDERAVCARSRVSILRAYVRNPSNKKVTNTLNEMRYWLLMMLFVACGICGVDGKNAQCYLFPLSS